MQDGLNWSRLEGEHANNAVLDVGKEGDFDELLVGWPQVCDACSRALCPTTIRCHSSGLPALLTGREFQRRGVPHVLPNYRQKLAQRPVALPCGCRQSGGGVYGPPIYLLVSPSFAVGWAKSQDGFKWEKVGKVRFERAEGSTFDERGISKRHVLKLETKEGGDEFTMVYEGIDAGGRHAIGG